MKKTLLFTGFALLFLFEILRVYLIMPMPGSQTFNSIDVAYFLGSNKNIFRLIGFLLLVFPCFVILKGNNTRHKIYLLAITVVYFIVFYIFTFRMEADKMFLKPGNKYFSDSSKNTIREDKLVIGVVVNGVAKAYPIQLIGYHHQIMDTIDKTPVIVTYCTVCRTGRAFSPLVNGKVESFRLVGMDHFNAMFEDATTKSWWRQATGEAIAGPLKGAKLSEIASEQMRLNVWLRNYPNSLILQPDSTFKEIFEKMDTYDKGIGKGKLTRRDSASWQFKSWVIGVDYNNQSKTFDWNDLTTKKIIQDSLSNLPIVILLENDTATFHAYNRTISTDVLNFYKQGDTIKDSNSNSVWNYDGLCTEGKFKGTKLAKVSAYQEFLHSWEHFHPKSVRSN